MPPTFVNPNTQWSSSSWYILQDYMNRKYILAKTKDEFLKNQLKSNTMDLMYNVSYPATNSTNITNLSGSVYSYNDTFFTESGISFPSNTTFDVNKYNKLINLPTPLGYVEVKWGLSDNNLDSLESSSPKMAGDVTVNFTKLKGAIVDTPVFVFMSAAYNKVQATDPINIFRLYKIKNQTDFIAEIKNELTYGAQSASLGIYNGITPVLDTNNLTENCKSDKYKSPGCSISFLNNQTIIGKLRFTLYSSDLTTVLHYGYTTLQEMQSGIHFKDYLGNDTVSVCIYEGYISLPYNDSYTFLSSHDDGVLITLNGVNIINNNNYGTDTSNSYSMNAGTYTFKVKLTNTGGPGNINIQYKTNANTNFQDIPTAWFSVTYFVNMSDYLQNIYNIQSNNCSNNLNNSWCKQLTKLSTTDGSNIYKKYCISNSAYLTDLQSYNTCMDYYGDQTNDFTNTVKNYCTDNSRLFNNSCIPNLTTNPSYLTTPIWEGKKKYCDNTKFATDVNCQNTISNKDNISLFDKLLGDNCSADKLSTEPCKSAALISNSATDFIKLPYYTFQGIKKCITADGKLDVSTQFCKDTANDIYSKKGAFLMEPVMNYCKGTTTNNGVTSNNITNEFCTNYINNHKCATSGFTSEREWDIQSEPATCPFSINIDRYYSIFIFILIIVLSVVLIKLNFKINNIYNVQEHHNEGR
jgi:hypothetical protein